MRLLCDLSAAVAVGQYPRCISIYHTSIVYHCADDVRTRHDVRKYVRHNGDIIERFVSAPAIQLPLMKGGGGRGQDGMPMVGGEENGIHVYRYVSVHRPANGRSN